MGSGSLICFFIASLKVCACECAQLYTFRHSMHIRFFDFFSLLSFPLRLISKSNLHLYAIRTHTHIDSRTSPRMHGRRALRSALCVSRVWDYFFNIMPKTETPCNQYTFRSDSKFCNFFLKINTKNPKTATSTAQHSECRKKNDFLRRVMSRRKDEERKE